VEEGRRMLQDSGLKFTVADGLYEAAQKAVALVG
jgi:succinyl-CoA synthetase beta subunit